MSHAAPKPNSVALIEPQASRAANAFASAFRSSLPQVPLHQASAASVGKPTIQHATSTAPAGHLPKTHPIPRPIGSLPSDTASTGTPQPTQPVCPRCARSSGSIVDLRSEWRPVVHFAYHDSFSASHQCLARPSLIFALSMSRHSHTWPMLVSFSVVSPLPQTPTHFRCRWPAATKNDRIAQQAASNPSGHAARVHSSTVPHATLPPALSQYRRTGNTERFGFITPPNWFASPAHFVNGRGQSGSVEFGLSVFHMWLQHVVSQFHTDPMLLSFSVVRRFHHGNWHTCVADCHQW